MTAGAPTAQPNMVGDVRHDLTVCPHCGHNLVAETPFRIGALYFDPFGDPIWQGRRVHLTWAERALLGGLVGAAGALVRSDVLSERIGHDGDGNVPSVLVHRIREKLAPGLIQTVRREGYRLNAEFAIAADREREAA